MEFEKFIEPSTVIIFIYAPAGLGHLRVSNAFSHGLKKIVSPVLLGSSDASIGAMHRFMSIHKVTRSLMETSQRGRLEDIFAVLYRNFLRSTAYKIESDIDNVLSQRMDLAKDVLVVASHFEMAHQIADIKDELEITKGIRLVLAVQVTDDSPQHMWYVPNSTVTFVPSVETKEALEEYGRKANLPPIRIEVLPYPISPLLGETMTRDQVESRKEQLNPRSDTQVNFCVPISGAAVGTCFFEDLMVNVFNDNHRFKFHVVAKNAPFTKSFIRELSRYEFVSMHTSNFSREVVDVYDNLYRNTIIGIEVTKPSEQAFKALFSSEQYGGSVLLFSTPVGRQEYDNINFLRKHKLIFSKEETQMLWNLSFEGKSIGDTGILSLFKDKTKIRGIEIPSDAQLASKFILWAFNQGLLEKIVEYGSFLFKNISLETRSDGVELFWHRIYDLMYKEN